MRQAGSKHLWISERGYIEPEALVIMVIVLTIAAYAVFGESLATYIKTLLT